MLSWNGKPNGHFDRNQKPSCYQVKQIFSTWVTPKQYFLGNILAMEGISPIFSLSKTSNSISSLTARPSIDSNLSRAVFTYWVFTTAHCTVGTNPARKWWCLTHFQWFSYTFCLPQNLIFRNDGTWDPIFISHMWQIQPQSFPTVQF